MQPADHRFEASCRRNTDAGNSACGLHLTLRTGFASHDTCCTQVGPPSAAQDPAFYSASAEVTYDIKPSRSLNQRFTPPHGLRTMAVSSSR